MLERGLGSSSASSRSTSAIAMHGQSISQLVYRHLFAVSRASDPPCFSAHLKNNLVPEIRQETSTFYGSFESLEAKYPGLDYTHPPHRMRLGRFPHHRRLFRAFDELGLTKNEILSLCRWEGTRWARESYERQERVKIRDTTGDGISPWVDPVSRHQPRSMTAVHVELPRARPRIGAHAVVDPTEEDSGEGEEGDEADEELEEGEMIEVIEEEEEEEDQEDDYEEGEVEEADETGEPDEEESEEELESVGIELNQRLSAAAEARERGADVIMDEAWEQWLKEASERGILTDPTGAIRAGYPFPPFVHMLSSSSSPPPPPSSRPSTTRSPPSADMIPARASATTRGLPSNATPSRAPALRYLPSAADRILARATMSRSLPPASSNGVAPPSNWTARAT